MDGCCEYLKWSEEICTGIYNMFDEDDDLLQDNTDHWF